MQTNPSSQNVVLITFDGAKLTNLDPYIIQTKIDGNFSFIPPDEEENYILTYLTIPPSKRKGTSYFGPDNNIFYKNLVKQVSLKYEIFDVNFTDEIEVFNKAQGIKIRGIVCDKPDNSAELNDPKVKNDYSENGPWPYSYRRFLYEGSWHQEKKWYDYYQQNFDPIMRNNAYYQQDIYNTESGWHYVMVGLAERIGVAPMDRNSNRFKEILTPSNKISLLANYNANNFFLIFTNALDFNPIIVPNSGFIGYNPYDLSSTENQAVENTSHELAHVLYLSHDGYKQPNKPKDEYYFGHKNWAPIMGAITDTDFGQWSKGEYTYANNFQDDILKINYNFPLIKPPKQKVLDRDEKYSTQEDFEFVLKKETDEWDANKNGYNIRVLTSKDFGDYPYAVSGKIGFPYDFDVLKIGLKAGVYKFTIPITKENSRSDLLDPCIEYVNCICEKNKADYSSASYDQKELPAIYPTNSTVYCGSFSKNDPFENKYKIILDSKGDDNSKLVGVEDNSTSITIPLLFDSIIYLIIRGAKNLTPDIGWSRYSSVGNYELVIKNAYMPFNTNPVENISGDANYLYGNQNDPKSFEQKCRGEEYYWASNTISQTISGALKNEIHPNLIIYGLDEGIEYDANKDSYNDFQLVKAPIVINGEYKMKNLLVSSYKSIDDIEQWRILQQFQTNELGPTIISEFNILMNTPKFDKLAVIELLDTKYSFLKPSIITLEKSFLQKIHLSHHTLVHGTLNETHSHELFNIN